jgi:hypothetical protein
VVVRSPADSEHPYQVRFADGTEVSLRRDQVTILARYKESEIPEAPSGMAALHELLVRIRLGNHAKE